MTFIPVGYLEAQAIFRTPAQGGPAMVVTGHEQYALASPDEEAEYIAEGIWGGTGSLLTRMSDDYALVQVNVYANQGGPDLNIGQWNGELEGGAGVAEPPQVSVLIQKQSGFAGRANRGRMYVPGVPNGAVGADGDLDGTNLTNFQAAADAFLNFSESGTGNLVILHNNPALTPTTVTALSVQALVATQRRRVR